MKIDSPRVEVLAATPEQEPVLANLLELYVHDFSEFLDLEIGDDGRFGYPSLSIYWSEAGHYPFLIRADDKLAGLALVREESIPSSGLAAWDVAEFFILRGWRGRGVGNLAAHALWRRFPGHWEIRVMQRNAPARLFWAKAVAAFGGDLIPRQIEKNGESWDVFSLHTDQGAVLNVRT